MEMKWYDYIMMVIIIPFAIVGWCLTYPARVLDEMMNDLK